jgi:serine/threonine-protein kinase
VAQVGVQVAEALEYAAGQGVLHRDVKPSNLLLDVFGTAWLTDFGLAKATGTPDLTRPGHLLGTLRYLAPERFQGHADVRSDVYALGLTLYEMLALRPAFDSRDQAELTRQITAAEAPRLDRLEPQLPRDLVTIVHKAMAPDPADRYQSAAALAEDLRRFLDDRSIVARRASLPEQAWRWCRHNPPKVALVAALLALLLLATGGGVWLLGERARRRAEAARQEEELRREVGTALAQAVRFRKAFHFREARELLEQTRDRLEPAGPDDLRRRLDQARDDLNLAERLDAARLQAKTTVEGEWDRAGGERLYAAAFAEAGLGREGEVEAMAARVRDSAVAEEVVAALDDWASLTKDRARRKWLLAVARRADPDPWRDRLRQPKLWQDGARLKRLVGQVKVAELSPQLATALARALREGGEDAVPLLSAVQARLPNDFWLNLHLAGACHEAGRFDAALGYYRAALALRPQAGAVHNNLGAVLGNKGQTDEAIRHFRQALRIDPRYAAVHLNLAIALRIKGRLEDAIGHCRQALRIEPKFALAHNGLGAAVQAKGRTDEAIAHYRDALRCDPRSAAAHCNLGNALRDKGKMEEAIGQYRQALRIDPTFALAHNNLGNALRTKGRTEEAISHYRRALRSDPTFALAYYNLGNARQAAGRTDDAIAHYRQALRLAPQMVQAHYNLGNALRDKGQLDEAIAHYRKALRLDPREARAHCNLGLALQQQGRFAEAVVHLKRGHELGSKDPRWPYPSGQWLEQAQRLAALERKLPAVLRGQVKPASAAEGLQLAQLCQLAKRHAAAARLYAAAFAADARLAGDLRAGARYNAACAAALAAAGQGADAALLDDKGRTRWRKQALDWLRADLSAWAKSADRALLEQRLKHWQRDGDLVAVRDEGSLANLPPAECRAWRKLWSEVADLLRKTASIQSAE